MANAAAWFGVKVTKAPLISAAGGHGAEPGVLAKLSDFSNALQRGETQAALEAARDACLAAPNMAEAHYAFGQAWMAAGKPERAEQAFAIAAKLRPNFADAWVNLGLARHARGAVEDAKRSMLRALQAQPAIPRRRAISQRFCG